MFKAKLCVKLRRKKIRSFLGINFRIKTQELAAAYVSTRGPGSIIGDEVLDFQVRNGTGYFHFSIATSKVEYKK